MHNLRPTPRSPNRRWGGRVAVVAVVAIAFVVLRTSTELNEAEPTPGRAAPEGDDPDHWMSDLLDHHALRQQPTGAEPARLRSIEARVGLPVRVPELQRFGAHWVGADDIPWHSHRAVLLRYRLRRHAVTVYLYDSEQTPLRTLAALHPRVVENAVVFVGESRGYSVAVVEKMGLGHAVVTDLSLDECAELATAIPTD